MTDTEKRNYTLETLNDEDIEIIGQEIDAILNDTKYYTKH